MLLSEAGCCKFAHDEILCDEACTYHCVVAMWCVLFVVLGGGCGTVWYYDDF